MTKQFFFGDIAPAGGGIPSIASQVDYLQAHGITAHLSADLKSFVSFDIGVGATDIKYFVQMGNKGTWSQADVDVNAPVPHLGDALFTENFDGYDNSVQTTYYDNEKAVFAAVDLNKANGWTGSGSDPAKSELGANGYGGIASTSGGFWLDTQNSPGQVGISHTFTDSTAAIAGKTAVLSFDIAKQSLTYQGTHYATASDAAFEFRVDGVTVKHINAIDLAVDNKMYHFDVDIASYADAGPTHTLELVDVSTNQSVTGFSLDLILIRDWVI